MTGQKIWSVVISHTEKIVDIATQYTTASLANEPSYVLPTAFGVEGVLLYKYLDSNMFAVTTQSQEDLSVYTIMLVNSLTGSIVYQQ